MISHDVHMGSSFGNHLDLYILPLHPVTSQVSHRMISTRERHVEIKVILLFALLCRKSTDVFTVISYRNSSQTYCHEDFTVKTTNGRKTPNSDWRGHYLVTHQK